MLNHEMTTAQRIISIKKDLVYLRGRLEDSDYRWKAIQEIEFLELRLQILESEISVGDENV